MNPCTRCDGLGRLTAHSVACSRCNGSGNEPARPTPAGQPMPIVHPLDLGGVTIGMVEQRDGSIRFVP